MVNYFLFSKIAFLICGCGGMADAADSKSAGFTIVWVQVPPSAFEKKKILGKRLGFFFFRSEGLPCPYGPSSTLRFGRCKADVHRTSSTPPSAILICGPLSKLCLLSPVTMVKCFIWISLPMNTSESALK